MPSYYDSTKAKPGLAEIEYQRGGEVSPLSGPLVGPALGEPSQEGLAEAARKVKRVSGASMTPAKKKRLNAVLAAEFAANKIKKGGAVKKMRHGGKLKVRGMGAATRGGNFSRSG